MGLAPWAALLGAGTSGCVAATAVPLAAGVAPAGIGPSAIPIALAGDAFVSTAVVLAWLLAASARPSGGDDLRLYAPGDEGAFIDGCPSPRTCRYLDAEQCKTVPEDCFCPCGTSPFAGITPASPRAEIPRDIWPRL